MCDLGWVMCVTLYCWMGYVCDLGWAMCVTLYCWMGYVCDLGWDYVCDLVLLDGLCV